MGLSISPDLERRIAEQAEAAGYASADAFLRALLNGTLSATNPAAMNDVEFFQLLEELASDDLPNLPEDFSRADIYPDHD